MLSPISIAKIILFEGRATQRKRNVRNVEESTTDESDVEDNTRLFDRITRSGDALSKIRAAIAAINVGTPSLPKDSMECIIGCGRNKSMLLLPCQHQHTCKECWLIWKIESLKNVTKELLDSSTYDDTLMQPKCPMCKQVVDKEIIAFN